MRQWYAEMLFVRIARKHYGRQICPEMDTSTEALKTGYVQNKH